MRSASFQSLDEYYLLSTRQKISRKYTKIIKIKIFFAWFTSIINSNMSTQISIWSKTWQFSQEREKERYKYINGLETVHSSGVYPERLP